jgi:hypothetical protein
MRVLVWTEKNNLTSFLFFFGPSLQISERDEQNGSTRNDGIDTVSLDECFGFVQDEPQPHEPEHGIRLQQSSVINTCFACEVSPAH